MGDFSVQLPEPVRKSLRHVKHAIRVAWYFGNQRHCPVCGKSSRRFRAAGAVPRPEARCVHCGALERHRLLWLYLKQRTDLFDGKPKKVLHVAPESSLEPRFRQLLGDSYLTADLHKPRAQIKMDITDIQLPDQTFDVIYCSHVLEHVVDDRKAMREFHRVLKDDGWAILLVPIMTDKTFEDPSIVDPAERLKAFGQWDHVRKYGHDYVDRLRESGFNVQIARVDDLARSDDVVAMGLATSAGAIYHCTKSPPLAEKRAHNERRPARNTLI